MFRVYFSNIRSQWPIDRQERALTEAVPGWRDHPSYTDILSEASKRRQRPLPERDTNLLRRVGRMAPDGTTVLVAALPVIAWTPGDFMAVLIKLAGRHELLRSVAENMVIDPMAADMEELRKVFQQAARRFSYKGVTGGEASGQIRHATAMEKIKRIEPYWPLSDSQYSINWICREFKISRPTLLKHMPDRATAQQRYKSGLRTAESNSKRRKTDD